MSPNAQVPWSWWFLPAVVALCAVPEAAMAIREMGNREGIQAQLDCEAACASWGEGPGRATCPGLVCGCEGSP